jgi:tyrosine-protein kinase
LLFLI